MRARWFYMLNRWLKHELVGNVQLHRMIPSFFFSWSFVYLLVHYCAESAFINRVGSVCVFFFESMALDGARWHFQSAGDDFIRWDLVLLGMIVMNGVLVFSRREWHGREGLLTAKEEWV